MAALSDGATVMVERTLDGGNLYFHLDASGRLLAASGIGPKGVIARDIRFAEMLIARRAIPDPAALASPHIKREGLLR